MGESSASYIHMVFFIYFFKKIMLTRARAHTNLLGYGSWSSWKYACLNIWLVFWSRCNTWSRSVWSFTWQKKNAWKLSENMQILNLSLLPLVIYLFIWSPPLTFMSSPRPKALVLINIRVIYSRKYLNHLQHLYYYIKVERR